MLTLESPLKLDASVAKAVNLTSKFGDVDLRRIGDHVWAGYEADVQSRAGWLKRTETALDLAMQIVKEKNFPWPKASNVAFPLVTIGAMQFHARAYPAIISGKELVRYKLPFGADPQLTQIAEAVSRYMSFQLLEQDASWEEGQDRLLLHYSIVGCAFKKSYFSAIESGVVSELVFARDLVIDYFAKSVESARRKTHVYPLYRNTIFEGVRSPNPRFRDVLETSWFTAGPTPPADERPARDGSTPPPATDSSLPFTAIEQHCWLDLDGDGYEEPYIVILERDSREVLRIVARWESDNQVFRNGRGEVVSIQATEYFTKYGFIPAPDGSIYDIGFGTLLGPLNESVSTLINQLVDAGTMSNAGGGFLGKGVKIRGGNYAFSPQEWKRVDSTGDDLRKSIVPLDVREPSNVLFQLLGLLIDYSNRVASTMETMVGENPGQNTPKSNMDAMIEQGMKVYAAIFKRTWRSMKEEFKKIYLLNAFYAPERYRKFFLGDPRLVVPAADPNIVSDAERRQQAIIIAERASAVPGYNPAAVEANLLRALKVDNPAEFYVGVDPSKQTPDPRIVVAQMDNETKREAMQLEFRKFVVELMSEQRKREAEILHLQASAQQALAAARGEDDNRIIVAMQTTLAAMKQRDEATKSRIDALLKLAEIESEPERKKPDTGDVRRLVGAPRDESPSPALESAAGGFEGSMGLG